MPDYITFENWPEHGRWLEFLKQEKQMKEYYTILDVDKYFGHLPVKERAKKVGLTVWNYYRIKRKYDLTKVK